MRASAMPLGTSASCGVVKKKFPAESLLFPAEVTGNLAPAATSATGLVRTIEEVRVTCSSLPTSPLVLPHCCPARLALSRGTLCSVANADMNGEQAPADRFQGPRALSDSTTMPLERDGASLDSHQPAHAGSDE